MTAFRENETILIRVTSVHDPPYHYQLENGTWTGMFFEILDDIARVSNFRYMVTTPTDGTFGADNGNGSFDGMVGMLQRNEADVACATLSVTEGRLNAADFAPPLLFSGYSLLMGVPTQENRERFLCLKPFSTYLWLLILGSVLVYMVAVLIVISMEWKINMSSLTDKTKDGEPKQTNNLHYSLIPLHEIASQLFGIWQAQGMVYDSKCLSSRICIGAVWLWSIILAVTYSGNLIAYLAIPPHIQKVNTLHEAHAQGIQIGILRGTALSELLSESGDSVYRDIWSSIVGEDTFMETYREGYAKALDDSRFAYLEWDEIYHAFDIRSDLQPLGTRCDFMIAEEITFKSYMSMALQKNSRIQKKFASSIAKMWDTGIITHIQNKWRKRKNDKCEWQVPKPTETPINLNSAQGTFYILFIGTGLSLLCFAYELLYGKCRKSI